MATNITNATPSAPVNVFITGATSALGREVTRQLKAKGYTVTGATNGSENAFLVRADGGIPSYPDLMRAGELRSVMLAAKSEVAINLAPQQANHLPQQRAAWNAKLLDEGVSALEEAAQAAGIKFLIHTSYAFADEDSEELDEVLSAALAGEQTVLKSALPGCVLRMGFLYGAQSPELVATRDTLLMGKTIDCGNEHSHSAWINVPDAARAVVAAVEQRPAGLKVTVTEDAAATPAAFMGYFAQSQGMSKPGHAQRFAVWAQPTKSQVALMSFSPHASNADAKAKLSWEPRFKDYHQGIDDTLLSWRAAAEAAQPNA